MSSHALQPATSATPALTPLAASDRDAARARFRVLRPHVQGSLPLAWVVGECGAEGEWMATFALLHCYPSALHSEPDGEP